MKKNLLNNLKYIAFGLVLAAGVTVAAAWSDPTAAAPGNNVPVPLHTGASQVKTPGDCATGNCGGLSVGPFAVFQNAEFDQDAYINGEVRGGDPTTADSQVLFGDAAHTVNGTVNGNVNAVGALQSGSVANSSSQTLCAAKDGTIVTCGTPAAPIESYTVSAQEAVWPIPDYAYDGNANDAYAVSFCLTGEAERPLSFTVEYTSDKGIAHTVSANIPAGQTCVNQAPTGVVLAADSNPAQHTQVGNTQKQCLYENGDPSYSGVAYQGYGVNVDPSLQCKS